MQIESEYQYQYSTSNQSNINMAQVLIQQANRSYNLYYPLYDDGELYYSITRNIITGQITFWKTFSAQLERQLSLGNLDCSSLIDILRIDDNIQNSKKQQQEVQDNSWIFSNSDSMSPINEPILTQQNKAIQQFFLNQSSHRRRKRPGRSSADPQMELQILKWIKLKLAKNPQFKMTMNALRDKALQFSNIPKFQASKGWIEKFINRFPNVNKYLVRRQKKNSQNITKGFRQFLNDRRNYTYNEDLERRYNLLKKKKLFRNSFDIGERLNQLKIKQESEIQIYFSE